MKSTLFQKKIVSLQKSIKICRVMAEKFDVAMSVEIDTGFKKFISINFLGEFYVISISL